MEEETGATATAAAMSVQEATGLNALSRDLLCNILARLPPPTLAISRCVCSTWNQIVSSKQPRETPPAWCFLLSGLMLYEEPERFDMVSIRTPYVYTSPSCWAYNPSENKWFALRPPEPQVPDAGFFNEYVASSGFGGLVAFQPGGDENICTDFWVGNPLTAKWRVVPWPIPREEEDDDDDDEEVDDKGHVTQLAVDEASGCYKIVVFLVKRAEKFCPPPDVFWATHVYDSASRSWTARGTMSHRRPVTNGSYYLDGIVYLLQWSDELKTQLQVLAYHVDRDEFFVTIPAASVRVPNTALKLRAVLQMTVRKDDSAGSKLAVEFLGALSLGHGGFVLDSILNLCVFKYDAVNSCWVGDKKDQSKVRDFYPLNVFSTDVYLHSSGQSGVAFLSPQDSKESGGILVYDSVKAQGSYLVHPGHGAHGICGGAADETLASLTTSIGSFVPRLDMEP